MLCLGCALLAAGAKQGTTWTLNICHQLRTGGTWDFTDLLAVTPWIEFLEYPGQPLEERLAHMDAHVPPAMPRVFKSHLAPPFVPLDQGVKFVIPIRNLKDSIVSFRPFFESHSKEFKELWGFPPPEVRRCWQHPRPPNASAAPSGSLASAPAGCLSTTHGHGHGHVGHIHCVVSAAHSPQLLRLHSLSTCFLTRPASSRF